MTSKPKHRHTFSGKVVVCIVCALVVIAACVTIYIKNSNKNQKQDTVKIIPKSTSSQDITKAADEKSSSSKKSSGEKKGTPGSNDKTVQSKLIGTVYFDPNESALVQENYEAIDNIITSLNEYKDAFIQVEGNTADSSDTLDNGNYQTDDIISYKRAKAVAVYMKSKGAYMGRVVLISNGSKKPVSENNTEDGRKDNRRVEIRIVYIN